MLDGPFESEQTLRDRDRIRGDGKVLNAIDLEHGPAVGARLGGALTVGAGAQEQIRA